jgi:hypothetical protein
MPSDLLRPRRADEHCAAEAMAARDAGVTVALMNHDTLADPGEADRAVVRVPESGETAVYRGWMLHASHYAVLVRTLATRGVTLRTSAAQYQQAHELRAGIARSPRSPRKRSGPRVTENESSCWPESISGRDLQCCANTSSR